MSSLSIRLGLIAHRDTQLLTAIADALAVRTEWPKVSLGAELASHLSDLAPRERPSRVRGSLTQILAAHESGAVICTDIDLLFEPLLSLDPLSLLRESSRRTRLIVLWSGLCTTGLLTYAVPEHAFYRHWPMPQRQTHCIIV